MGADTAALRGIRNLSFNLVKAVVAHERMVTAGEQWIVGNGMMSLRVAKSNTQWGGLVLVWHATSTLMVQGAHACATAAHSIFGRATGECMAPFPPPPVPPLVLPMRERGSGGAAVLASASDAEQSEGSAGWGWIRWLYGKVATPGVASSTKAQEDAARMSGPAVAGDEAGDGRFFLYLATSAWNENTISND